ncbi:MAG: hypothetical protein ED557_08275 [Balneola sp.]|nr:MAG: hypothetical protein ED557_08275 [Balneola sp.]
MQEVKVARTGITRSTKSGNWQIYLNDPSLNKFQLGPTLSNDYISTEIISPLSQRSTFYNTVSKQRDEQVTVYLDFKEVDQTRVANIELNASDDFFKHWRVALIDNRTKSSVEITTTSSHKVEPIIELNKLMKMGFVEGQNHSGKSYFELQLTPSK